MPIRFLANVVSARVLELHHRVAGNGLIKQEQKTSSDYVFIELHKTVNKTKDVRRQVMS